MNRQRGGTMVYVLIVISMLLVMSLGATALSMGGLARARSDQKNAIAFNAAQAVLEIGVTETLDRLESNHGDFTSYSGTVSSLVDSIAPGCTATYTLTPSSSDTQYGWITATVTYLGKTKSLRGTLNAKDLGIWNNAVFAGSGAAGRSINGNVDIRGSVHILGEGEPYVDTNGNGTWTAAETYTDKNGNNVWDPGEPFVDTNGNNVWTSAEPYNDLNGNGSYDSPIIASEMGSEFSGGAKIGNNYTGMDSTLEAQVATSPKKNGIETLSAELRVKHGKVSLDGSATVGEVGPVDSGTSKATLDGVYVNDGWAGNKGAESVYSDNGTSNAYDIETIDIKMPLLSGIGAKAYVDSSGTSWTDQETYMNARSLSISKTSLTASTAAFSYGPDAYGNSITFVPASGSTPALLNITGVIKVPAAFQIGANDTIRYSGNGSFWCPGTIKIDGNFTPAPGLSFPVTARVGLIAKNTIALASGSGSSQLTMAAAFYAQNAITSQKQNKIAGTFVATTFDMGTNVPNIYQIPVLRSNLPPAMPGAEPIIFLNLRGWRERQ